MGKQRRVLASAYRHGVVREDILTAWEDFIVEFVERDDPVKAIRIGFDTRARLLEIGGEIHTDGQEVVFHAMPARKRYLERIRWYG